jgi:hypothetical protein
MPGGEMRVAVERDDPVLEGKKVPLAGVE